MPPEQPVMAVYEKGQLLAACVRRYAGAPLGLLAHPAAVHIALWSWSSEACMLGNVGKAPPIVNKPHANTISM